MLIKEGIISLDHGMRIRKQKQQKLYALILG